MKTFFGALLLLLSGPAFAVQTMPTADTVRALLNAPSPGALVQSRLGYQVIDHKVQVLRAVYDSAMQGKAAATYTMTDEDGKDAVLPAKAIIKQATCHAIAAVTSGSSATLAVGAASTTDIIDATDGAKANWTLNAILAGSADGAADNMIRLSSATTLTATVGTAALTAGKIECFFEYYIGH